MQLAVIEYARHMAGLDGANSTEFEPDTPHPVVALITEWQNRDGSIERRDNSPTWAGPCASARSRARSCRARSRNRIYGTTTVSERHRHRYEVNNHYLPRLEAAGLTVGAWTKSAVAGDLCEMIELSGHPLVLRLPVPPRVHVESAARPSAVHRLRERRAGAPSRPARRRRASAAAAGRLSRRATAASDETVRIRGRPGPASVPDRGSVRGRVRAAAGRRRRPAQGNVRRPGTAVHLQVVVRQGQPQLLASRFAGRACTRACACSPR